MPYFDSSKAQIAALAEGIEGMLRKLDDAKEGDPCSRCGKPLEMVQGSPPFVTCPACDAAGEPGVDPE